MLKPSNDLLFEHHFIGAVPHRGYIQLSSKAEALTFSEGLKTETYSSRDVQL